MLTGNNQSSRAGLLSCADSITCRVHFLPIFGLGFVLVVSHLQFNRNGTLLIARKTFLGEHRLMLPLVRLLHRNRPREQNVVFQVNVLVKIGFKIRERPVQRLVADTRVGMPTRTVERETMAISG